MHLRRGFTSRAVHGGRIADAHKSVVPPIYQTAELRIAGNQEVCTTRASQGNQVIIPRIG